MNKYQEPSLLDHVDDGELVEELDRRGAIDDKPTPPQTPAQQLIALVDRFMREPEIDAAKLEKLLTLQERILERSAKIEFAKALSEIKGRLRPIFADAINNQTNSRYATDAQIAKFADPILYECGFGCSFAQEDSPIDRHYRVVGTFSHAGGHEEIRHVDVPVDLTGIKGTQNKTNTHAWKSSLTYGKVALKRMFFDIPVSQDQDDDGNAAGGRVVETISEAQQIEIESQLDSLTSQDADDARYAILHRYRIDTSIENPLSRIPAAEYQYVMDRIPKWQREKSAKGKR